MNVAAPGYDIIKAMHRSTDEKVMDKVGELIEEWDQATMQA